MRADELMTSPVVTCRATDSLNVPAQLMWECDCGAVPVLDADDKLVGMITDRDICIAGHMQGKPYAEIPVSTAMSRSIVACGPSESVSSVESSMRRHQIRRIPVVENDKVIGILSLNDVATRTTARRGATSELGADAVAATLAAICARPTEATAM
jgi:CBS domain-containing protein